MHLHSRYGGAWLNMAGFLPKGCRHPAGAVTVTIVPCAGEQPRPAPCCIYMPHRLTSWCGSGGAVCPEPCPTSRPDRPSPKSGPPAPIQVIAARVGDSRPSRPSRPILVRLGTRLRATAVGGGARWRLMESRPLVGLGRLPGYSSRQSLCSIRMASGDPAKVAAHLSAADCDLAV